MKLYTRTGDDGTTGLHGGARVSKTDPRVAAYGDCDECNAAIGFARAASGDSAAGNHHRDFINACLDELQRLLFEIGADLATPAMSQARKKVSPVTDEDIARLERWIDEATDQTEPQKTFVLPGGSELAARLHLARVVCRRAERSILALIESQGGAGGGDGGGDTGATGAAGAIVEPRSIAWINRAGDLLFILARLANHAVGVPDTPWIPRARQASERT